MTEFGQNEAHAICPKTGEWFVVENIDRTVYRWMKYKPQGAKQMGQPGRWQKQVWHGDFFKWENCKPPEGVYVGTDLAEPGPMRKAYEASKDPAAVVRLWSEQSPEPVPSHGGNAVATYWHLEVAGVEIGYESDRRHWSADREKYAKIEYAPRNLVALFEALTEALKPKAIS